MMHAMPHYRILNSPEIAMRASVISPPPPCHKEPFPSVSAAGPGFLSRAAAHPSRQGTSTLAASISASGFLSSEEPQKKSHASSAQHICSKSTPGGARCPQASKFYSYTLLLPSPARGRPCLSFPACMKEL